MGVLIEDSMLIWVDNGGDFENDGTWFLFERVTF